MDDLISKRSATERLIIAKTLLETVLQDMPTAEPKKGKWISETGQYYQVLRCDQCGHVTVEQVRNYCPNCGAKMDGGTEWAR